MRPGPQSSCDRANAKFSYYQVSQSQSFSDFGSRFLFAESPCNAHAEPGKMSSKATKAKVSLNRSLEDVSTRSARHVHASYCQERSCMTRDGRPRTPVRHFVCARLLAYLSQALCFVSASQTQAVSLPKRTQFILPNGQHAWHLALRSQSDLLELQRVVAESMTLGEQNNGWDSSWQTWICLLEMQAHAGTVIVPAFPTCERSQIFALCLQV